MAGLVLLLIATVYVARQDERAAQKSAQDAARFGKSAVSAKANEEHTNENAPDAERNTPGWYGFFRWPSGTTTWAIVLTLLAIAEQAKHTAKAANIANKTLISTLRPKLIIRKIRIHRGTGISTVGIPDPDPWRVNFEAANVGQGAAHILEYRFDIQKIDSGLPADIPPISGDAKREEFALEPGQRKVLFIDIDKELTDILRMIGESGLAQGYQNTNKLYFWGNTRYTDNLRTARNASVCRHYDNVSRTFRPVDDPDREYSD